MEQQYDTAEELINGTVEGSQGSPDAMLAAMREKAERLEAEEAAKVKTYVDGVRGAVQGVMVQELEDGIGGVYTGDRIAIATSTLQVGASIDETVAQVQETGKHEKYHKAHDHLAPVQLGGSADGENVVTIAGEGFTDTRMVEALTVHDTGAEFVSSEYVEHERAVSRALVRASLGWEDVREAINVRKDYGVLDDASRGVTEPDLALSA